MFSTVNALTVEVFLNGSTPHPFGFRTRHRYEVVNVVVRGWQQRGHVSVANSYAYFLPVLGLRRLVDGVSSFPLPLPVWEASLPSPLP